MFYLIIFSTKVLEQKKKSFQIFGVGENIHCVREIFNNPPPPECTYDLFSPITFLEIDT